MFHLVCSLLVLVHFVIKCSNTCFSSEFHFIFLSLLVLKRLHLLSILHLTFPIIEFRRVSHIPFQILESFCFLFLLLLQVFIFAQNCSHIELHFRCLAEGWRWSSQENYLKLELKQFSQINIPIVTVVELQLLLLRLFNFLRNLLKLIRSLIKLKFEFDRNILLLFGL